MSGCRVAAVLLLALLGARVAHATQQTPAEGPPNHTIVAEVSARAGADLDAYLTAVPLDDPLTMLRALHARASAVRRQDPVTASRMYDAALRIATRSGDDTLRAQALVGVGLANGQRGEYAAASAQLSEAFQLLVKAGDQLNAAAAANNLGIVQRRTGDYDGALRSYAYAVEYQRSVGRLDAVARTLNNIGSVHLEQGNGRAALEAFTESLALKEKHGTPDEIPSTLGNIATLHLAQGNYQEALRVLDRSLALAGKAGPESQGHLHLQIARAHFSLGRTRDAEVSYQRAYDVAQPPGLTPIMMRALQGRGYVAMVERRYEEAEALLARGLELTEAAGDLYLQSEVLGNLAAMYRVRGQHGRAFELATRAAAMARRTGTVPTLADALYEMGAAAERLGRIDEARSSYEAAINAVETVRSNLAGDETERARFFSEQLEAYYALASLHAAAGRSSDAFATVERARARALLDVLAGGRPVVRAMTFEEQGEERRLDQALLAASMDLAAERQQGNDGSERIAALSARVEAARAARSRFAERLYSERPELRMGRGVLPIATIEQAARALPERSALVEFLVGESRTWVFVLRKGADGAPVLTLDAANVPRERVVKLADEFTTRVAGRNLAFAQPARDLYGLLFAPIEARLTSIDAIIVVPDGALWAVPFAALRTTRDKYLIEERGVSVIPSATALHALTTRDVQRGTRAVRVLAMGDPAPAGQGVPRLPNAVREVRQIADVYGVDNTTVLVGEDALERRFREEAPRATVVHIATHGVLDDANPQFSRVALAGSAGARASDDGKLEAWEIGNIDLPADLVVMSACDTARGQAGGEGVFGISWAIFSAGASSAALSLWQVDSASTTRMMIDFHRERARRLGTGGANAAALQRAAVALLGSAEYRHPYYWAGFVVVGRP